MKSLSTICLKMTLLLFILFGFLGVNAKSVLSNDFKNSNYIKSEPGSRLMKNKSSKPGKLNTLAHVYFSNEIPVAGKAPEIKEFVINSKGGYVYLVVNNYPDNFNYDELHLKVSKTINGVNETLDKKVYTISNDIYSTYIKYSFFNAGYYTFEVSSKYDNYVGSASCTVKMDNGTLSSTTTNYDDCISGSYKKYYNTTMGFSMCIPSGSYGEDAGDNKITIQDFYGKKVNITFNKESSFPDGVDKFDASVIDMTRDLVKTSFTSYYRKEFNLLSSDRGNTIYRSVISATSNDGTHYQESIFYIHMTGNKIRGNDYMTLSGPLVSVSDDLLYQIIIEKGMLKYLKIY